MKQSFTLLKWQLFLKFKTRITVVITNEYKPGLSWCCDTLLIWKIWRSNNIPSEYLVALLTQVPHWSHQDGKWTIHKHTQMFYFIALKRLSRKALTQRWVVLSPHSVDVQQVCNSLLLLKNRNRNVCIRTRMLNLKGLQWQKYVQCFVLIFDT